MGRANHRPKVTEYRILLNGENAAGVSGSYGTAHFEAMRHAYDYAHDGDVDVQRKESREWVTIAHIAHLTRDNGNNN